MINQWLPKENAESGSETEGSENVFLAFKKTGAKWLVKKNHDSYILEKSLNKRDFIDNEGEGANKESRNFPTL